MAPAGVSVMRPWARSNRRVLKYASSCLIWKVTAGCVMKSASAALVNDRCFATAWNTWRRRSAIQESYVSSGHYDFVGVVRRRIPLDRAAFGVVAAPALGAHVAA